MAHKTTAEPKTLPATSPARRLSTIAVAGGAVAALMALTVPIAHADVKQLDDCLRGATIQGSVFKDCCTSAGGTCNPNDHGEETCWFNGNAVIGRIPGQQQLDTTPAPPPPPPGATAIIPPGLNTRAGIQ